MTFNQPLETRNVRRVDDMSYMFYQVTSFNQDPSNWNTNGIWGMNYMFSETTVHTAMHDTLNRILTKIRSALKRSLKKNEYNYIHIRSILEYESKRIHNRGYFG